MPANSIDLSIIHFFNQFCRRSELFDRGIAILVNNTLLKGGILMIVLWYQWYQPANKFIKDQHTRRVQIISTICGCFASMFTVRMLTKILPFRTRPILEAGNHLIAAYGLSGNFVDNTNSFPSDHASLFFGLAAGIFLISARLGFASLVYVLLVIAFPRIYLGWHYPSDILGGAFIGVFFILVANMNFFKVAVSERIYKLSEDYPQLFYPIFFLLTYQIATLFEGIRTIIEFMLHPYRN